MAKRTAALKNAVELGLVQKLRMLSLDRLLYSTSKHKASARLNRCYTSSSAAWKLSAYELDGYFFARLNMCACTSARP